MKILEIKTDFLVLGGGIAGLRAAIGASRYGEVLILNKGLTNESSSAIAQGGVAAALGKEVEEIQSHFQDTLDAGRGLCRKEAVQVLVEEGPQLIYELISWGAEFDKVGEQFALAREGAHRKDRILRAKGDSTGNEIVRTLKKAIVTNPAVTVLDGHFSSDLITINNRDGETRCRGVQVLDERTGAIKRFLADAVILATGGSGQVYRRTTNPPVSTGDGLAMALLAGAELEDMAFFQFHPTALSLAAAPSFLLSEAMRGEGGRILDAEGKSFLDRYHPDAELAPRDLVTRAIRKEIKASRRSHVFLDMTHLDSEFVRKRFPKIYVTCLRYGIDITSDRIPVAPSAHYMMGGVKSDLYGRTNIPGLYAVGEVAATGVHGANRLASNSLLESLVFGARVGDVVGPDRLKSPFSSTEFSESASTASAVKTVASQTPEAYFLVQKNLREMMWRRVGIIRCEDSLKKAIKRWQKWHSFLKADPHSRLALETRNMLWAAASMIESALRLQESIGAHFREDFPDRMEDQAPEHIALNRSTLKRNFPI